MSEYSIQSETLSDIANSIRAKTGKNNAMTPLEMPTEIGSIGGGSGDIVATLKNYAKFNNTGIYLNGYTINADYKVTVEFYQTTYLSAENIIGNNESNNYSQLTVYQNAWYMSTGTTEPGSGYGTWKKGAHEFITNDGTGHNKLDGNNISNYTPTTRSTTEYSIGYRAGASNFNSYLKSYKIEKISTGEKILELKPAIVNASLKTLMSDGASGYVSKTTTYTNKHCLFDVVNEQIFIPAGTINCVDSIPS